MYIGKRIVEQPSGMTLDEYVPEFLYSTGYGTHLLQSAGTFSEERSFLLNNNYFRYQTVHGCVRRHGCSHDGGVEGHAGLFSTADDPRRSCSPCCSTVAATEVCSISNPETVELFTKNRAVFPAWIRFGTNLRPIRPKQSAGKYASAATYGHQGFTGICVWGRSGQ